ncbi:hypothetical protein AVEN_177877-1 [Araneus ventricosus]|uniref:Uncharacterized protein n=1 Tax=Araneus ventricosus TaxID=182803 RepID=A0A4Y2UQG1_ARAVE|nr:hypothetical protein AVEN_177877-1 [Araneus ventricosus]
MVTSELSLTCCKLTASLHTCHDKFVANFHSCHDKFVASLLQTKIAIWDTGPRPAISRKEKTFVLKINNKNITVSVDRIKPAYVLSESSDSLLSTHKIEDAPSPIYEPENEPAIVKPITTRSGRHAHFPKRLITVM